MRLLQFLQRPSWAEYLGRLAGPALVALVLASFVRQAELRQLLKHLVVACFMAAFAAKEIADFPALWQKARSDFRSRGGLHRLLSAFIAPEAQGLLRTLGRLLAGFVSWAMRRRPPRDEASGLAVTYLKRSGYRALVPFAVLALCVDVPVSALILPALGVPESLQSGIRSTVFLLGILTLAGLLGDRWHLSSGQHVLTDDALVLKVGVRFQAAVPLHAIEHAQLMDRAGRVSARWSEREIVASPFDKPNIKLLLDSRECLEVTAWGCPFSNVRCVYLYVDDPKSLLARLHTRA